MPKIAMRKPQFDILGDFCPDTQIETLPKGENEIDIVAESELSDEAVFIEVKRKEENFDAEVLRGKVNAFTRATGDIRFSKKDCRWQICDVR